MKTVWTVVWKDLLELVDTVIRVVLGIVFLTVTLGLSSALLGLLVNALGMFVFGQYLAKVIVLQPLANWKVLLTDGALVLVGIGIVGLVFAMIMGVFGWIQGVRDRAMEIEREVSFGGVEFHREEGAVVVHFRCEGKDALGLVMDIADLVGVSRENACEILVQATRDVNFDAGYSAIEDAAKALSDAMEGESDEARR